MSDVEVVVEECERKRVVKMKRHGRVWLPIVVILMGFSLVMSCMPIAGGSAQSPHTADTSSDAKPTDELTNLIDMHPGQIDNLDLPITPLEELHQTGSASEEVDIEQYRLIIDGLVETPLALDYETILTYPTVTEVVLLICPGFFVDNAEWTGVPVSELLSEAGIKPETTVVTFYDSGTYSKTLTLDVVQQDGIFLAYVVNGQTLPLEHGYPLRLVAKGRFGYDWVKWVEHITIS